MIPVFTRDIHAMQFAVTLVFAAIIVGLVLANRKLGFDRSIGETGPKWVDKALYPKAFVHGVTAFAAMAIMLMFGVWPLVAAALLLAGIAGWEWSQGYWNRLDIVAGIVGMLFALTLFHFRFWTLWVA